MATTSLLGDTRSLNHRVYLPVLVPVVVLARPRRKDQVVSTLPRLEHLPKLGVHGDRLPSPSRLLGPEVDGSESHPPRQMHHTIAAHGYGSRQRTLAVRKLNRHNTQNIYVPEYEPIVQYLEDVQPPLRDGTLMVGG